MIAITTVQVEQVKQPEKFVIFKFNSYREAESFAERHNMQIFKDADGKTFYVGSKEIHDVYVGSVVTDE
jgi:hypothetical protein